MNKKRWTEMTTDELREATKEFDAEDLSEPKPLSKADRELHRRAALRGRPKIGKGAKRVMVSVERGLLKKVDGYAKAQGMSRSQLIAEALRGVLGKAS